MADQPVSVRFFQPSWFLIQHGDMTVYIDPAYMKKYYIYSPDKVVFPDSPNSDDGLPEADLPRADLILITHQHQDHCQVLTLAHLTKDNTIIIAPKQCKEMLAQFGEIVRLANPGDHLQIGEASVEATFAYNTETGSSTKKIHEKGACLGWLLRIGGKIIFHAGDTDFIPEMSKLGHVDLALLPVGGTYTMDAEEAARATAAIQPNTVIPMHNLGADLGEFEFQVTMLAQARVVLLASGETLSL